MRNSRAMPAGSAACPKVSADWIEQKIFRAYVQLAVEPCHSETSRTVTLGRFGDFEIALTELYGAEKEGVPPFWLELRAQGSGAAVDSIGFHEFDEDEMTAAIAFVQGADHQLRVLH